MNTIKKFLQQLWYLVGAPRPATEDQKNEKLVTMRQRRDCLVAALATLCSVTYEQAYKALWHFDLPFFLESPIFSNPLNAEQAAKALGFKPKKRKVSELINGLLPSGKTLVLVHDTRNAVTGTLMQHWVVLMGRNAKMDYLCHWGVSQELKTVTEAEMIDYITSGWPNCIISVGE